MINLKCSSWGTIGVVCGLAISMLIGGLALSSTSGRSPAVTMPDGRNAAEVARPHLEWAASQCSSEVEQPLTHIRMLFVQARSNTRAFAEEAMGWNSKLTMVSDFVQQTDAHGAFLRRKFEDLVLSEAALLESLESAIGQYQQATASVEGEMLVRLRADVGDFVDCPLTEDVDIAALQSQFQLALDQAGDAASFDLTAAMGREVASFVLSEIATQVAVQLGVNAGILGAGATSSWGTFGVGLLVGVAVDQVVTVAYDSYADPKGELSRQIDAQLNEMERLVIEGTETHPGLATKLREFATQRAQAREAAVYKLLGMENGGAI